MHNDPKVFWTGVLYVLVSVMSLAAAYLLIDHLPPVSSFLPGTFSRVQ